MWRITSRFSLQPPVALRRINTVDSTMLTNLLCNKMISVAATAGRQSVQVFDRVCQIHPQFTRSFGTTSQGTKQDRRNSQLFLDVRKFATVDELSDAYTQQVKSVGITVSKLCACIQRLGEIAASNRANNSHSRMTQSPEAGRRAMATALMFFDDLTRVLDEGRVLSPVQLHVVITACNRLGINSDSIGKRICQQMALLAPTATQKELTSLYFAMSSTSFNASCMKQALSCILNQFNTRISMDGIALNDLLALFRAAKNANHHEGLEKFRKAMFEAVKRQVPHTSALSSHNIHFLLRNCVSVENVIDVVRGFKDTPMFDHANVTESLHRYGKVIHDQRTAMLGREDEAMATQTREFLDELAAVFAAHRLDTFKPLEIAHAVFGYGWVNCPHVELGNELIHQTRRVLTSANAFDVENCVWGFVASGLKSDAAAAIVSDLLSEAKNRLRYDKFEVAGLERMLWACENAAPPRPDHKEYITLALSAKGISSQEVLALSHGESAISNSMVFARSPEMLLAGYRMWVKSPGFTVVNLTTCVYKLGLLCAGESLPISKDTCIAFYDSVVDYLTTRGLWGQLDSRQVANMLVGYGWAGHDHHKLVEKLAERVLMYASTMNARDVWGAVFGLSKASHLSVEVESVLATLLRRALVEVKAGKFATNTTLLTATSRQSPAVREFFNTLGLE